MNLQQKFKKWRKLSYQQLDIEEANWWWMIQAGNEVYIPGHAVLRTLKQNFKSLHRKMSDESRGRRSLAELIKDYREAIRDGDRQSAANYLMLLQISKYLSPKPEQVIKG